MFKGVSSRRISQEFRMLKQDFRTNNFWARKYEAKEVAPEELNTIANYIRNQKKDLLEKINFMEGLVFIALTLN